MSTDAHSAHNPDQAAAPIGHRKALVVGVNHAPEEPRLPSLRHAEQGAEQLAATLTSEPCAFGFVTQPLLGPHATTTAVKTAFFQALDTLDATDVLLFSFSGHGQLVSITAEEADVYLVTHDFTEKHLEYDEDAHLSMRWLQDKVLQNWHDYSLARLLLCGRDWYTIPRSLR